MKLQLSWTNVAIGAIGAGLLLNSALSAPNGEEAKSAADSTYVSLHNTAFTALKHDQQISALRACFYNARGIDQTITTYEQQVTFATTSLNRNTTYIEDGPHTRFYTPDEGTVVKIQAVKNAEGRQTNFGTKNAVLKASSISECHFTPAQ
ncbi:MAG: hypothetical protein H6861_05420 [Rhodospirillales bacterium]|nr:hypothetical protein [Rhodospirillales bacterium]